jgi:hypothetical protein
VDRVTVDKFVHIEIDAWRESHPHCGRIRTEPGDELAFTGWIELIAMLDRSLRGRTEPR